MAEKCSGTGAMLSFLAGAAVGTGLALLYAPKTGKEVRGRITDLSNDTVSKMKGYGSQAQDKMKSFYNTGRDMFREKKEQMSATMETGEEPLGRA
ncbi:YtxH domain-containing protein [Geotalea toluenoxydans]|uniref:YtxH domain-containing protein n=1 Tax=Geotalea toluenoxydans TaxID=421624 RepID=UPI0006CF6D16|nr:YtxH domain-containing protein [Geotalea toluenoxydans]